MNSPRRVFLIRAVNVGGAKLPMARLREIAADLGATNISTYIASGNLVCAAPGDFEGRLEDAIEQQFGFFREVISRDVDELKQAVTDYPFDQTEPKFAHIYFLQHEPKQAKLDEFNTSPWTPDLAQVRGRDLYLRYGEGAATSKLTAPLIHRRLGVVGTGRNMNTVKKLIDLALL